MSDRDLFDAEARKTSESNHEIARRGFVLTSPEDAGTGPEPECLLDVMLVDLPETGTVDWDALGFGYRGPFSVSEVKASQRKTPSPKQQVARTACGSTRSINGPGINRPWPK